MRGVVWGAFCSAVLLTLVGLARADVVEHSCEDHNCSGGLDDEDARENSAAWARGRARSGSSDLGTQVITHPEKLLTCCSQAAPGSCQRACRAALRRPTTDASVLDALEGGGCGPPQLHEPLWQCLLSAGSHSDLESRPANPARTPGADAAKLHCCPLARAPACRRLCLQAFSRDWAASWPQLDEQCLPLISERRLADCLQEVDEPCWLGCEGLSYCAFLNGHPGELFRSCSAQADAGARWDVAAWIQDGAVTLSSGTPGPGQLLPLRNDSARCGPEAWRAVACVLHAKPCHAHAHTARICREECVRLLTECVDWPRMPAGLSAAAVCGTLAPESSADPCVSLDGLLLPPPPLSAPVEPQVDVQLADEEVVTVPCRGRPCGPSEVCLPERNCSARSCLPYTCVPGCRLGSVSPLTVPVGALVRVPGPGAARGCHSLCRCGHDGVLSQCVSLPCYPPDACWLGARRIEHRAVLYLECNVCSCVAGDLSCTRRPCSPQRPGARPCLCPSHLVPVCGVNGQTYPNACAARCAGLRDADVSPGPCEEIDPCVAKPCRSGETCVPDPRVCLSLEQRPCRQHMCVNGSQVCERLPRQPMCDTLGQSHQNPCFLVRGGRRVAHRGTCHSSAIVDAPAEVCGADGVTYSSWGAADAMLAPVDYGGPCAAECTADACPPLPGDGCIGLVPPGACCPICAGGLRAMIGHKQLDRGVLALKEAGISELGDDLTLAGLLRSLQALVQLAQCECRGFMTLDGELVVLVTARTPAASVRDACVREAERLSGLLSQSGAGLQARLGLSAVTAAAPLHARLEPSGAPGLQPHPGRLLLLIVLVCWRLQTQ